MNIIFIIILIISIVIHELAHGYTADYLGDPTARLQGRLTLNPISHMDLFGSVILPFILIISGAPFVLGWAKPVPFNPHNLDNPRRGGALIALMGPVSNVILALVFALVARFVGPDTTLYAFSQAVVVINIALAVFNLVPIPPLDGHHLLFAAIPDRYYRIKETLRKNAMIILVLFVLFGWQLISPVIFWAANLLI
jgi:Zn-dependent protease